MIEMFVYKYLTFKTVITYISLLKFLKMFTIVIQNYIQLFNIRLII